jgi:hypothetical protein
MVHTPESRAPIIVKFMAKYLTKERAAGWRRQLPDAAPVWGRCRFEFDPDCRNYDWVAVYDDLSPRTNERFSVRVEPLACPRERTILVTSEPAPIKDYGQDFVGQFGLVLTSQEPQVMPYPNVIHTQLGLRWFYGMSDERRYSYDRMLAFPPTEKTKQISTVCSNKVRDPRTLHGARVRLTEQLQREMPELDWFGRGVRPIADKADALDSYRYHIAVENHIAPHYWTEKLADPFLGLALPFYCGCPNVDDYFPRESYIAIDVNDVAGSIRIIRDAVANGEYEKRLPFIRDARQRVLERYNLFAGLASWIEARHEAGAGESRQPTKLYSRRALRYSSVKHFMRSIGDKLRPRFRGSH